MQEHIITLAALSDALPSFLDLQGWGDNLLVGLSKTLIIAFGAFVLGLLIGVLGALGKIHGPGPLRWFLELYTTIIRAVPELVLILLLYYAGTKAFNSILESFGYKKIDISGVAAGIAVLGVVMGAYITEVIRAAIQSVPAGQIEAGKAYGMSAWKIIFRITLPAMMPFAIPGLANLWLIVMKDTALLAVVGFEELASVVEAAGKITYRPLFFYCIGFLLYLLATLVSNVIINKIEAYYRRGQPKLERG